MMAESCNRQTCVFPGLFQEQKHSGSAAISSNIDKALMAWRAILWQSTAAKLESPVQSSRARAEGASEDC